MLRIFCLAVLTLHGVTEAAPFYWFREFGGSVFHTSNLLVLMDFCVFSVHTHLAASVWRFEAWDAKWNENANLRAIMGASNRYKIQFNQTAWLLHSFLLCAFFLSSETCNFCSSLSQAIIRTESNRIEVKYIVVTRFYYDVIFVSALANNSWIFQFNPN